MPAHHAKDPCSSLQMLAIAKLWLRFAPSVASSLKCRLIAPL